MYVFLKNLNWEESKESKINWYLTFVWKKNAKIKKSCVIKLTKIYEAFLVFSRHQFCVFFKHLWQIVVSISEQEHKF